MANDATLYADRDHEAQGAYYLRHVEAMTAEGLHRKSAIAGELAHRDIVIAELRADVEKGSRRKAELGIMYVNEKQRADTAEARLERAMRFMREVRECLERENVGGGIADTLWVGPCETLFDAIDAFLGEGK